MSTSSEVVPAGPPDTNLIPSSVDATYEPIAWGRRSCTPSQARTELELLPETGALRSTTADDHILVPDNSIAHLGADLSVSCQESARERDLMDPTFRGKVLTTHRLLNYRTNRHGHPIAGSEITLDRTQPRVHLVVVPNGLGQRALIHALGQFLGNALRQVDVTVGPGQIIRYFRIESLLLPGALLRNARHIARYIARLVDGKLDSGLSRPSKGSLFQTEDDAVTSVQAILIAVNVGAIIVGPIHTSDAQSQHAACGLNMLARIAEATGIPMVVVTTGGGAVGLIENSASLGTLSSRGVYSVEPLVHTSGEWKNVALIVWLKYIEPGSPAPAWFVTDLWSLTFGRVELAVKLGSYIAGAWAVDGQQKLTMELLKAYASSALALEQPYLAALNRADNGGTFTRGQIMRFADWLPLRTVLQSFPSLDLKEHYGVESTYPKRSSSRTAPYGVSSYAPMVARFPEPSEKD